MSAQVLEGYDVVKKMEDVGSTSGKPTGQVLVTDCGLWTEDMKSPDSEPAQTKEPEPAEAQAA